VLLSQRSLESDRQNRTRALPVGATRNVAIPSKARLNPEQGGWAFSVRAKTEREKTRASQPDEPFVDPPYLFVRGVAWRGRSDTTAGWELVSGLKSSGQTARIAAALLTQSEDMPVRPRVRANGRSGQAIPAERSGAIDVSKPAAMMNIPYELEIIENCVSCELRRDKWFCGLSPEVLKSFGAARHLSTYLGSEILFVEGQPPRGVLVLCSGKVKLSTTSRDGKVLILKRAGPGEALGLSAVISGRNTK